MHIYTQLDGGGGGGFCYPSLRWYGVADNGDHAEPCTYYRTDRARVGSSLSGTRAASYGCACCRKEDVRR